MSPHYPVKCKTCSSDWRKCCIPPNAIVDSEKSRLWCVATGMSCKQRHSKCSKWTPSARIRASSLFRHYHSCIVHHTVLKFSACRNKTLPQLVRIADWYSIHAPLQHAPDAVIYLVEVRTVGWPHVRTDELRCLTAQKIDCVTSTMCWHIILLEEKHVTSNPADCCSRIRISNTSR